jgi:hypothetical protein
MASVSSGRGNVLKLNNNYKGAYARGVMYNEPDLPGFITTAILLTKQIPHARFSLLTRMALMGLTFPAIR